MYSVKLLLSVLMLINITCTNPTEPENRGTGSLMFVYSNNGKKFYYMDDKTFQIIKECNLKNIDSLTVYLMGISNNKDYLIFNSNAGAPYFQQYLIVYEISSDSIYHVFATGLDSAGAPRLSPSYMPNEPGLIYMYSHTLGTYAIDFLKKEITLITEDKWISKEFYSSQDKKLLIINKISRKYNPQGQSEIEIYNTNSGLNSVPIILNNDQQNGIEFEDLVISEDNKEIFVTFDLPDRSQHFGSLNIENKEFYRAPIDFPRILNPYYLAYSQKRKEIYLVGAYDKFYIFDVTSKDYNIKTVVDLNGKLEGPSRITIRPDEGVAFISCIDSNLIFVIDLNTRKIIKKISIEWPYLIIPL